MSMHEYRKYFTPRGGRDSETGQFISKVDARLRNAEEAAAEDVTPPVPERTKVNEFEHEGMRFESWRTPDWWEVKFFLPDREREIGMRRERHAFYSLVHVEELAKEMAIRIRPRFTNHG